MIFGSLDHEIGYVGAGDAETKPRKVAFVHPIFRGSRLVRQSWWANDRPFKAAVLNDVFHFAGIAHNGREEEPAEKIGWRKERILEQEGGRLNDNPPNSVLTHRVGERGRAALEKGSVRLRHGQTRAKGGQNGIVTFKDSLKFWPLRELPHPEWKLAWPFQRLF